VRGVSRPGYAAAVSDLERRHPSKNEVAQEHVPQLVVPVPVEEVRAMVSDETRDTTLTSYFGRYCAGWLLTGMRLRMTPVDSAHTRIEIEVASNGKVLDVLLYQQNRSMVDRFFVAIQDELDRRARWHYAQPPEALEERSDPAPPGQDEASGNL